MANHIGLTRKAAILTNSTMYDISRPCEVCGSSLRYTSTYACVECSNHGVAQPHTKGRGDQSRKMNADARREAVLAGVSTYMRESNCPKCNTYLRYTCNGGCVECIKIRGAKNYAEVAQYKGLAAYPIVPAHMTCKHGELLAGILPDLEGKTLQLANHPWGAELLGEPAHYGKCALCHPSRTITLFNKMQREGGIDADLAPAGRWLTAVMRRTEQFPHGLAAFCLAEKAKASTSRTADVVPVPPPKIDSRIIEQIERLKRID